MFLASNKRWRHVRVSSRVFRHRQDFTFIGVLEYWQRRYWLLTKEFAIAFLLGTFAIMLRVYDPL